MTEATAATTNVITVQSRVDEFLMTFGSEIASDQHLRMMIGLMILNALLGNNEEEQRNRRGRDPEEGGMHVDIVI